MATDFMEGALGWRQRLAIYLHLAICHGCRAFMQQMRRTVHAIRRLPAAPPTRETEARVLAVLSGDAPPTR